MNDKNNFSSPSDEHYEDALDDNFEFDDLDYDDVDLGGESDEFESDYGGDEDDFDVDDDWQDEEFTQEAPAAALQEKKKLNLDFNTIVIIGAVIVGGIVMMSTVSSSKKELASKTPDTKNIASNLSMGGSFEGISAMKEQKEPEKSTESKENESFNFDMDEFDVDTAVIEDVPPMPSPIVTDDNLQVVDIAATQNDNVSDVTVVDEVDVAEVKQEDQISDIEPIFKEENMQQVAAMGQLEKKLDLIFQRLDGIENKIKTLENVDSAKAAAMTAELDEVKKEFTNSVKSKESDTVPEVVEESKVEEKPKAVEAVKPSAKTTPVTTPKKVVKKSVKKKIVKKARWELRAAQPGKAWVARKGSQEMTPIIVGDKLSDIGRIQSISYSNGKWLVQGSAGKIQQ